MRSDQNSSGINQFSYVFRPPRLEITYSSERSSNNCYRSFSQLSRTIMEVSFLRAKMWPFCTDTKLHPDSLYFAVALPIGFELRTQVLIYSEGSTRVHATSFPVSLKRRAFSSTAFRLHLRKGPCWHLKMLSRVSGPSTYHVALLWRSSRNGWVFSAISGKHLVGWLIIPKNDLTPAMLIEARILVLAMVFLGSPDMPCALKT